MIILYEMFEKVKVDLHIKHSLFILSLLLIMFYNKTIVLFTIV